VPSSGVGCAQNLSPLSSVFSQSCCVLDGHTRPFTAVICPSSSLSTATSTARCTTLYHFLFKTVVLRARYGSFKRFIQSLHIQFFCWHFKTLPLNFSATDRCRSYRCDCVDGYHGANCETADHCHSSPCRHGGTCLPLEDGYTCRCDIEFQGRDCRHETPCNGHGKRCYNDGVCKQRPVSGEAWELPPGETAAAAADDQDVEFYCECQPGYSGTRCQDFDPCSSGNTCINGGTCQVMKLSRSM